MVLCGNICRAAHHVANVYGSWPFNSLCPNGVLVELVDDVFHPHVLISYETTLRYNFRHNIRTRYYLLEYLSTPRSTCSCDEAGAYDARLKLSSLKKFVMYFGSKLSESVL